MTDKLLTTISSKHTPWKFYLPWIKLKNGTDVLMILRELEVAFLTKNMEFDYLNLREAVLQRLVPVKLTDIQPILISMRNHCQDPYASSKNTEDPYPRPIQQTIKKFWKGIKTATPFVTFPKPGNQITYGPDSDRAPIKLLDRGRFRELWILPYTDPPLVMKKPLRTDDYASYLMQLRTLKDLAHENVVRYYDRPVDPQIDSAEWLIFMEYCEHGSLRDVLQNQEIAYSMATVAKWSTEMFSGLKHIQSKKIIHHDIKPDNLFVHGHGYILKLGNFESTFSELTGWVVLDMVNRSESGCKDIDFILRDDLPHLETIKKLVIGMTKRPGEVFDEDHPQISMKKVLTTKDATHGWKKLGRDEIDLKVVKPLINRFWKDIMRVGLGQTVGQPNSVVEVHADAMEHKPIGGALRKRFR
ncbi:unnamed protein product, partial [Mesorhabditis spiculigera]